MNAQNAISAPSRPILPNTNEHTQNIDYLPQVVEILSETANGCILEVGYDHRVTQQFFEIQEENKRLRAQHARLFSDNRSLAQLISVQNGRLVQLLASPDHQSRIMIEMQNQIRAYEADREVLSFKYQKALEDIAHLRKEVDHLSGLLRQQPNGQMYLANGSSRSTPAQHIAGQRTVSQPMPQGNMGAEPEFGYTLPRPASSRNGHLLDASMPHFNNSKRLNDQSLDATGALRYVPVPQGMDTLASLPPLAMRGPPTAQAVRRHRTHDRTVSLPGTPTLTLTIPHLEDMPKEPHAAGIADSGSSLTPRKNVIDLTSPTDEQMENGPRKRQRVSEVEQTSLDKQTLSAPTQTPAPVPGEVNRTSGTPASPTDVHMNSPVDVNMNSPMDVHMSSPKVEHEILEHQSTGPPITVHEGVSVATTIRSSLAGALGGDTSEQQISGTTTEEPTADEGLPATPTSSLAGALGEDTPSEGIHAAGAPVEVVPDGAAAPEVGNIGNNAAASVATAYDEVERQFLQECVEENFDEGEGKDEGKLFCTMCRSRHMSRSTEEVPEPFVDANLEVLVAHCESEHPRGWERLKELVKQNFMELS